MSYLHEIERLSRDIELFSVSLLIDDLDLEFCQHRLDMKRMTLQHT